MEVEQAPFAPTIARCYLVILSIEHGLSQKLYLETVAIVAITNRVSSVKLNKTMTVNYIT